MELDLLEVKARYFFAFLMKHPVNCRVAAILEEGVAVVTNFSVIIKNKINT